MKYCKMTILLSVLLVVLLTGCSKSYKPQTSGIYIEKDGTITGAVIEEFDENTYSLDDLTAYIEEEISAFNEANVGEKRAYLDKKTKNDSLPVSIQSIKVKDGKVILLLDYTDTTSYLDFNKEEGSLTDFTITTVANAKDLSSTSFVDLKGNAVDVSSLNTDAYVISVKGITTVEVEGDLLAYSAGVSVDEDDIAAVDSTEANAYIIFEK